MGFRNMCLSVVANPMANARIILWTVSTDGVVVTTSRGTRIRGRDNPGSPPRACAVGWERRGRYPFRTNTPVDESLIILQSYIVELDRYAASNEDIVLVVGPHGGPRCGPPNQHWLVGSRSDPTWARAVRQENDANQPTDSAGTSTAEAVGWLGRPEPHAAGAQIPHRRAVPLDDPHRQDGG